MPKPFREPDLRQIGQQRLIRLIQGITGGCAVIVVSIGTVTAASQPIVGLSFLVSSLLALWIVYAMATHEKVEAAGTLLLVFVWGMATLGTVMTGGVETASFSWLLCCPLVGGLVKGRRGVWIGGMMGGITMAALVVAHHTGLAPPTSFSPRHLLIQDLIDSLGVTVVASLVVWIFLRERRWAEQQMSQNIGQLAHEIDVRSAAERRARHAGRTRARFLAMVSHELRTPLNGVLGLVQILEREELRADHLNLIRDIERSASHLLALVDQILEFSAAESDPGMRQDSFDFRSVLEDVAMTLASQAPAEIDLVVDLPSEFRVKRRGDHKRIAQVYLNLGGNALKFTEGGEVVLGARQRDDGKVLGFVRDTGTGIAPAMQEKLFEPFVQADSGVLRNRRGLGLGLAIVKQVIESLGGKVELESAPDEGSTFSFELQLPIVAPNPETADLQRLEAQKALVLLRSPTTTTVATEWLTEAGIEVLPPDADPASAPRLVLTDHPSLALARPWIDRGAVGILALRPGERWRDEATSEEPSAALAAKTTLPLRHGELLRLLTQILDPTLEVPRTEQDPATGLPSLAGRALVIEDDEVSSLVACRLLETLGFETCTAADGEEGLQQLRTGEFVVALIDGNLPSRDGCNIARTLRAEGFDTPMVGLTASAMPHDRNRFLDAGMNAYISKPFRFEELASILEKLLPASR